MRLADVPRLPTASTSTNVLAVATAARPPQGLISQQPEVYANKNACDNFVFNSFVSALQMIDMS